MTLWKDIHGYTYHHFEPFDDEPEIAPFAALVSIWRSKFKGNRIPAWSDFDFTDFVGWHSKLAIYDISYDPFDYKIRLSGEQFNQILGRNMMGVTRDELVEMSVEDDVSDEFYEKACSEMLMAYTKGINIVDRQHVNVEFLELPLSDNGLHATHTIETFIPTMLHTYRLPGRGKQVP